MGKTYRNKRYIYDPLYGVIYLPDFIWDIIPSPELQRLREVRLCNINSFCLIGGANINRYEHAIGTCYLAHECLKSWPPLNPMDEKERKLFLLAALLHDVPSAAFGHSVEYVESKIGFKHEAFKYAISGEEEAAAAAYLYKSATLEPIFFGMYRELLSKISSEDLNEIDKIIKGEGRFGPLINSTMDLDNIDNVFRLGYHIGTVNSGEVPLKLAMSLYTKNNKLIVRKEAIPLIEEWHGVRKKLYSLLLLNLEEFSAKCMLTEAMELAKIKKIHPFNWYDVDYELLEKLFKIPSVRIPIKERLFSLDIKFEDVLSKSIMTEELKILFRSHGIDITPSASIELEKDGWRIRSKAKEYFIKVKSGKLVVYKIGIRGIEISEIISRLMKGDLYGCIGIFSTAKTEKYGIFIDTNKRSELEDEITQIIRSKIASRFKSAMVALHSIIDVNKTERQVCIQTDDGRVVKIGKSSNRLLVGVFFRNRDLSIYKMKNVSNGTKIRQEVYTYLSNILEDPNLQEVKLYGEIDECK